MLIKGNSVASGVLWTDTIKERAGRTGALFEINSLILTVLFDAEAELVHPAVG